MYLRNTAPAPLNPLPTTANLQRPRRGLYLVRPAGTYRRRRGLGDDYYASACPEGTHDVNGGCFREPTYQSTPYGVVAVPSPGPSTDLAAAEAAARAAGIDLSCRRETIGAGTPFTYQQDICAVPGYGEGFDAALIAQPGGVNVLKTDLANLAPAPNSSTSYFNNPTFESHRTVAIPSPGGATVAQSNAPAPAVVPSPNGPTGQSNAPAAQTVTPTTTAPPTTPASSTTATWLPGIPNWAILAAGAVVAGLALKGK